MTTPTAVSKDGSAPRGEGARVGCEDSRLAGMVEAGRASAVREGGWGVAWAETC